MRTAAEATEAVRRAVVVVNFMVAACARIGSDDRWVVGCLVWSDEGK